MFKSITYSLHKLRNCKPLKIRGQHFITTLLKAYSKSETSTRLLYYLIVSTGYLAFLKRWTCKRVNYRLANYYRAIRLGLKEFTTGSFK